MNMVWHDLHFFNGNTNLIGLLLKELLQSGFNIAN